MNKFKQRMNIFTLGVRDLKVSEIFYEDILGWKRDSSSQEGIRFYQLNEMLFSIYPIEEFRKEQTKIKVASPSGFSLAYNVNSKEEVDSLYRYCIEKKVNVLKKPQDVFWGGYHFYFAGPDNELWEVAYNPYLKVK